MNPPWLEYESRFAELAKDDPIVHACMYMARRDNLPLATVLKVAVVELAKQNSDLRRLYELRAQTIVIKVSDDLA
jgi:hypothetical protein